MARGGMMPTSAPMWLRMGDDDRAKYGGPEWVVFDMAKLYHTPASQLEAFEMAMGFSIVALISEYLRYTARSTRGALFIARRLAGVKEEWDKFDPMTVQVFRSPKAPTALAAPKTAAANGSKTAGSGKGQTRTAPSSTGSKAAPSAKSSKTSPPA